MKGWFAPLLLVPLLACQELGPELIDIAPLEPVPEPVTSYASLVRSDAPVAYWRLEEQVGTIALDYSGSSHAGEYVEGPALGATVTLRLGRAIELSAGADGVRVPFAPWMNLPGAFSVEAWIRPSQVRYDEPILVVDKGNSWGLIIGEDGRPGFARPVGAGRAIGGTPLEIGQLYHLVGTYEPGVIRIYVNGVLAGEDRSALPPLATPDPMHLGRGLSSPRFEFVGALDEVAIYDRALPLSRIQAHYGAVVPPPQPEAATAYAELVKSDFPAAHWRLEERTVLVALDYSGFARAGEYIGNPILGATVAPRLGRGIELGAGSDGVHVAFGPWMSFPGGFTVEAWVRPSRVTYPEPVLVVDKGNSWGLIVGADGKPGFARPSGPGRAVSQTPLVVGELYHLVGTYELGVIRIYVNGVLAGEERSTPAPSSTIDPMHLGRGLSTPRFDFVGQLDEVALYDRVLPLARIQAHYAAGS